MMSTSFFFALLAATVSSQSNITTQPPIKAESRPGFKQDCLIYNKQDCRQFKLEEFRSDQVQNVMTIGNEKNMPAEFAKDFSGLFYMYGNPLDDEVLSLAGTVREDDGSYSTRVYDDGHWTWNSNTGGRLLYQFCRDNALTYYIKKLNETAYQITPVFYVAPILQGRRLEIPKQIAEFLIVKTSNPNVWSRPSSFFGKDVGAYQFTRIVDGNGNKTPEYESVYLANINNPTKNKAVTLRDTQLIARLA